MKKIINHIEKNYKEDKNYEVYSGYIKRFLDSHPVSISIIESIEDAIIESIKQNHKSYNEKYESQKYSILDVYTYLVNVFSKLFLAIEQKLDKKDVLLKSSYQNSPKGITISSVILRDNQEYNFITDCIYAGGYNIQCLHFRYLVKSSLAYVRKENRISDNQIISGIKKDESARKKLIKKIEALDEKCNKLNYELDDAYSQNASQRTVNNLSKKLSKQEDKLSELQYELEELERIIKGSAE